MRSQREARLRPGFAHLYPYLNAGVWESAAVLSDQIVANILGRPGGRFIQGERALDKNHFEFRGSEDGRPSPSTGRREDPE